MAVTTVVPVFILLVSLLYIAKDIPRVLQSWRFLFKGRAIMLDHTHQNPHQVLSLPIPGNTLHVMSTKQHWADINSAQYSQFSPNAASREMFQPKYTFGFEWGSPREQVSLATVRSIRNMTLKIPTMQDIFIGIMREELDRAVAKQPDNEGWSPVPLWETVQLVTTKINTTLILGYDIAKNEEFATRGRNFITQTTMILEAVRLVPSFLAPVITKLIKGRNRDQTFVFDTLARLIQDRRDYNLSVSETSKKTQTFLEGFIDFCPDDWTVRQSVESTNTMWVVSTLAIPIVACHLLQDIFTQTQYLPRLHKDAATVDLDKPEDVSSQLDNMKFLEAFIMESMRTKCFQSNTAHRIAVKPFEFSDGHKVQAGEAVEFHQRKLFTDALIYADPYRFEPLRFYDKGRSPVDTGFDWPFWGVPRHICPGRWHVVNVMKLLAVYVLKNFDAKLEDTKNMNFEWRDALVPNPKTILWMRPSSH